MNVPSDSLCRIGQGSSSFLPEQSISVRLVVQERFPSVSDGDSPSVIFQDESMTKVTIQVLKVHYSMGAAI